MPKKITDETKERVRELLRKGGKTYSNIAMCTGLSKTSVSDIAKPMIESSEIKPPKKAKRGKGIIVTDSDDLYGEAEPEAPTELQVAARSPREIMAAMDEKADLEDMTGEVWD